MGLSQKSEKKTKALFEKHFDTIVRIVCKKFKKLGAKIIGGCCETTPAHIKQIKNLS